MTLRRKQPKLNINDGLKEFNDELMIEYDLMMIDDHDCLFCCSPGLEELLPLSADIYCMWIDSWNT